MKLRCLSALIAAISITAVGCQGGGGGLGAPATVCVDLDGDGAGVGDSCVLTDCDDADPSVHPGTNEVPYDGLDNDCSAQTRDDDLDQDGAGVDTDCDDQDPARSPLLEEVPYDAVDNDCDLTTPDDDLDGDGYFSDLDCDDDDPDVNPGAQEIPYDNTNNDCDDATPDDDVDQDGHLALNDCDDENPDVHPEATEVPYDGVDNDCDDSTPDDDLDGDGFASDLDCDDDNAQVLPFGEEIPYDGMDNDCDETTVDDDLDGDGFDLEDDCDDEDDEVYPGAPEVSYDGKNNDCDDSTLDEDADGDGSTGDVDCDDQDDESYPGGAEVPDGKNNDCDDAIDEGTVAADDDGDGFCEGWEVGPDAFACSDASNPGDCDDEDATLTPADLDGDGASTCGGDCDDTSAALNTQDQDQDGVTTCENDCDDSTAEVTLLDADEDGFVACVDDCDDGDPAIHPDAAEIYYNGQDDDCDPLTVDQDQDGDGWLLEDDCDDLDGTVHPWAVEVPDNGLDEDCDGFDVTAFDGDELESMIPNEGVIPENGMLVAELGPYELVGDIVVPLDKTLVIGPGVQIHFMGPYKVLVHGTLVVLGTDQAPVIFSAAMGGPVPGDWLGIHFETTGTGLVQGAEIRYATTGIRADEATLEIRHTRVEQCLSGILVTGTDASPSLDHVELKNNNIGLELSWAGWGQDVFVNYSTIHENVTGVTGTGSSGLTLWNSKVLNNDLVGVHLDGATLWHCEISGNQIGLVTQGGWDTCTRSIISDNEVGVHLGIYPTRFSSNYNNIIDNTLYGFKYVGGNDDGAVNAELNWWGSMLGGDIAAAIWDFFDDTSLYYIDYIPFLRHSVESVGPIPEGAVDADGDHFFSVASGGNDCDDTDASINPDALDDQGDGIDDDCNGQADEDAPLDPDGDGFTVPEDCDNNDATIYPDATEIPDNGIDENCNGFDMVTAVQSDLSGVLPTDTLLTAANSPYVVSGDIFVAPDFVLKIEAGTEIRFDGYWSIIVFGDLLSNGVLENPVHIHAHSGQPGAQQWNRIWINDIGGGHLHHTLVEDADTALYIEDTSMEVTGGALRGSHTGLTVDGTGATVLVRQAEISDNQVGVNATWSGWSQDSRFRYTTISNNLQGILTSGSAGLDLWSCVIESNVDIGVQADGGLFRHNLFLNNGTALTTAGGWDTIERNVFDGNGVGVLVGSYPARPKIHHNAFINPDSYSVTYAGGNENAPVQAQHNWWDTTTLLEIREVTWDIFDDPNLFPVVVQPFLGAYTDSVGVVPEGTVDADGDGFFSIASGGNDCDDTSNAVHPDAADDDGDGLDDDCDGAADDEVLFDTDLDGIFNDLDCDDDDPAIYPGASEVPNNGIDEDCNGSDLATVTSDELGGVLEGDSILAASESPYVITSDLVVLPQTTLVIEAGTQLLFASAVGVLVKGTLIIEDGAALDPEFGDEAQSWKGIRVEGTGEAEIGAAFIAGADIGVEIIDTWASMTGTVIHDCLTGVRIDGTGATATIDGALIDSNGTGIMGSWCAWSGSVDVHASEVINNGNGILTTGSANVNVTDSWIASNDNIGFSMDGNLLQGSTVIYNGVGVETGGGWDDILDNVIETNGLGLKLGSYPQRPQIVGNNILNNSDFGLLYVGGNGDGPVDATGNWWGTADPSLISDMIWDLYDDTDLFEVVFEPSLEAANQGAGAD